MVENSLKNKTVNGFFWQLAQRVSCQLISFGISVILARLLAPNDYGIVAICSMLLVLIGLLIDGGLGTALIQKKNIDDLDLNTVFYTSTTCSLFVYGVVFITAPLISLLFDSPQITTVIRVLALNMPIGALTCVQNAFIQRQMAFRKYFVSSMYGTIFSGTVGVFMALKGFGVWALVGQSIISSLTNSIVLFIIVEWHPKWMFSWKRFKKLFYFGWRMAVINFLATFSSQLKGYVIGYKYSSSELAYYNRGEGIPGILSNNISGAINTVLFPTLSKLQDNQQAVKYVLARSMRTISFFLMPMLFGLAAISDKLILMVYSEKWASAVPFMQVICFIFCSDILGMANYQAIKAIGKVNVLLKLEFYKRPLMFVILIISMFISPLAIAIGQLFYSIFAFLINAYPTRKYINYPIHEQLVDVGGSFLSSLTMAIFVYFIGVFDFGAYTVFIQIFLGGLLYLLLANWLNKGDLLYAIHFFKKRLHKNNYAE